MESENITNLNIETLMSYSQCPCEYIDDYLVISKNLEHILVGNEQVRLNVFLILFCSNGLVQIELNEKTYLLRKNDLFVSLPSKIIRKVLASPDHKIDIIFLSPLFLHRIIQFNQNAWKAIHQELSNPQKHIGKEGYALFKQYYTLIHSRIQETTPPHRREILQHLLSAVCHEMIAKVDERSTLETNNNQKLKQHDYVFKRFIEILATDNGKHRSVAYYANQLCYSPKYLSRIVKQVSDKNALALINEHTLERIKFELRFSSKSIKEISLFFDFPNVSFFTKYVKKNLGMTPTEFRNKKEEASE